MISDKLQCTLIIVLIGYFILMCYFLKKKALSLKYTLLWLLSGVSLGILLLAPKILIFANYLIGVQENMNGLFIWAVGFIICILLSLTSIVSRQSNRIRQMVQVISRMEKRIRELEEKVKQ